MRAHPLPIGSRYKRTWTLAGVVASFLTAMPVVAFGQPEAGFDGLAGVTAGDPDTVAIVPFANISAQPSDDWIGSGIAETLSAEFERLATLRVIRRGALDAELRATGIDLPAAGGDESARAAYEAGRRLGAAWLVEGAYQRLGDRMRITARLIETATGAVAAGSKADGDLSDVFSLQDRIANELGAVLLARASGALRRDAAPLGHGNGDGYVGGNGNGNGDGALLVCRGPPPRRRWRRTGVRVVEVPTGSRSCRRAWGGAALPVRASHRQFVPRPRRPCRPPTWRAAWSWGRRPNRPANGRRLPGSPPLPAS